MAATQASANENRWLVWMFVDAVFVMLFLFALVFMEAGAMSTPVWFGVIGVSLILAVFVIPGWAVFGLAGGEEHE